MSARIIIRPPLTEAEVYAVEILRSLGYSVEIQEIAEACFRFRFKAATPGHEMYVSEWYKTRADARQAAEAYAKTQCRGDHAPGPDTDCACAGEGYFYAIIQEGV